MIYADPPWSYNDARMGTIDGGGASAHYELMSTEEICGLSVRELAASNAALFLWVTSPLALDGFEVMQAWGFQYKAMLKVSLRASPQAGALQMAP